jgi:hypothetical protein
VRGLLADTPNLPDPASRSRTTGSTGSASGRTRSRAVSPAC